jgi:hypothetical protein
VVWKKAGKIHIEPLSLEGISNPNAKQIEGKPEDEA